MKHKGLIMSLIIGIALLCPLALSKSSTHTVKANAGIESIQSDYSDNGSTAGTYSTNYKGQPQHDAEAQAADNLWSPQGDNQFAHPVDTGFYGKFLKNSKN